MAADDLTETGFLDLCHAQRMMWFDAQVSDGTGYRLGGWLKTDQTFDPAHLQKALMLLTQSHDALRLRVDRDSPRQRIVTDCTPPLTVIERETDDPDAAFSQHLEDMFAAPMPFGDDPLWRVHLIQMGGFNYVVLNFHHIIVDTVSVQLALSQLLQAYLGVASGQTQIDLPQSSFSSVLDADHDYAQSAQFQSDLDYWVDRYETLPPQLITTIPTETDDPFAQIAFRDIPAETGFLDAAEAAKLLPHRALFGLLAVILARRFGQTDLSCGLALHRRDRSSMQTVAMLAGLIPVRATFEDWWSLEDCIAAFDEHLDEDLRHNRLPIDTLYRALGIAGQTGRGLFDVTMSYVPGVGNLSLPTGSTSGLVETREASPISFHTSNDPKTGAFSYRIAVNPKYQDIITAEALADLLDVLIVQFADGEWLNFDDVANLSETESAALADLSAAAPLDGPLDGTVALPVRIAAHAAATPAAPALAVAAGAPLGYAALCAAARARARGLTAAGLAPGQVAAVLVDLNTADQAEDLIINLLAIWQAGGTFLPLNAADPAARLQQMAADAACALVLTPAAHHHIAAPLAQVLITDDPALAAAQALLCDDPEAPALDAPDPDATAYIYYTSGTTGIPKGVPITHQALAAFTAAIGQIMGTGQDTRALSAASPLFDALFMDLAATLAQGGLLIRLSARHLASPGYLQQAAAAHQANYMDLTPTVWRAALATGWTPPQGFTAVTGGEAMDATLAKRITAQGATLTNSYGPTEATVVAIAAPITAADIAQNQIPIGTPLPGVQAMILDDQLNPCPPGTPGALYLAGPQLSAGYIGRPGQTAAAFIAHPTRPGLRAYHTGDLAAWRMDGRIAYLGRIDDQIKIRGMRVELAEIEACLRAQAPATCPIAAAAVTLQEDMLAAYIVLAESAADTATPQNTKAAPERIALDPAQSAQIRAALAQTLPAHMVPAAIAAISHIPMTASGKINKAALPALSPQNDTPFAAPQGPLETQIAEQISDLIAAETGKPPAQISRHDSFFALGGHSLMAVRLIARLQETTATQIPLRALFEAKTIAALAAELGAAQKHAQLPPITAADRSQNLPLSYAQERLWFVERFAAPGTIAEVMGFDLTGPLDQPRLRAVFAALYARHEALRLIVDVAEGAPVQRFAAATDLPWHLHDLRDHSPQDQEAQIAALRAAPVDPAQGAFRIDLVQTGAEQHLLILALHHMIYDGVSLAVILAEIATLWAANGNPAALPARDIAYADFALWQRAALKEGPLKEGLDRFVTTLANPPAPLAIPADRPRPDHPTHAAAQIPVHLPAALTADLRALAQAQNASLFMLLQTALATLMAREARTDDIIIGTVAAGRAQAEVETAVGPFFNMIALRHKIDPAKSFTQTLAAARTQALTAFDDQLVPFEAVIERTITHRDARTAVSPLFQILFQLHTEAGNLIKPITLGGMAATPRDWGKMLAMQDLTFDLFETEAGIEGRLTYAIELFDAPRMQALIQRYIQILQSIVQNPDAACQTLNILPADQAAALADLSAAAPLDGPLDGTVALPVRIAAHAAATPAAPALAVAAGAPLGYAALCAAARARARGLTAAGLAPGQVAAVLVDLNTADQAEDLIINLLAIWQAGGTFLPLNAADPAARLQQMAADAACALVLTPAAHHHIAAPLAQVLITDDPALAAAQALLCDDPEAPALDAPDPDATAYIYYTSGTTGIPKGVPITHQALAAFTAAIGQIMGTGQDTRALSAASPLFDALFMDLAATLAQGGLLIRLSARHLASPGYLQQAAAAHQANYMDLTPTVWRAALATGWTPPQGFTAVTGGEAMDATLAKRITAQGATLTNSYGPTEATVVAIAAPITAADIAQNQIPIGTPLPGVQAMILDDQLNPCPPGTPGALYLAGPQLSAGYIGRPGQTAAAFIAHPTRPGLRAYHTGDLAAWRMDGRIAYLGRIDDQIKIRGMRVELAEIEACLRAQAPATCPIAAAAVTLQEDMLAAYIVLAESAADTATPQNTKAAPERIALDPAQSAQIRAALAQTLPAHMVPAAIAAISHIPMTASGKINKAALPALSPQNDTPFAAPQGPLETQIAEQISDLIAAETGKPPAQISRHDSFFALGGHSLMAVRLIARLQETTATQIPLRALFEAKTIAALAAELGAAQKHAQLPPITAADRSQNLPLSYAQERLWFVERFAAPGTIAEVMGFDLTGPLDQPRLRAVFAALYARHEALRLIVDVAEGAPVQRFAAATDLPWHLHDLRDHSPQDQEAQIAALRAAPVDPAQGAFRIDLVQTGAEQHLLILALHHMIYDGVSLAVILAEIATLWAANGNPAALPARDIAYADFALWQRAALKEGPLKEGLDRFVTTLANPPAPLAIPADRPRPDHPTHAAAQIPVHLPAALTADLRALAQAQNASLFMLLQTALATLMAREARTDDIIIGTVAAGRAQAEVETAVGPFFNMIALRHKIDPAKSFTQTLAAARTQALTAFDDQLVPFEAVIERTITHRDARTAVSPLFQILFQLHTEAGNLIKPITLGGMAATPRDWGKMLAMQDLTFDLFETEAGIEGRLTYAIELFDAPRMQALIQRYIQILQSIVQNPDAACQTLNILPADQAAALADLSAAAPLDGPLDGTVALPVRIAAHAAATPAAPALAVAAGAPLGYAALCAAARARARGLTAAGLAPGQVAAVLVDLNTADQAEDLIINLLAIWQAGGTFLPLNAADPAARLQQMAADAACALVLTPAAHHHIAAPLAQVLITDDPALAAAQALLCDDPEAPALDAPDPDATAYIYYTSGTTGIPKGVPITHQALAAFTAAIGQIMGTGQDTRALSAASPLFDALFMDLAATLAQGGLLIRLSARHLASPGYLQQAAAAHQANYMDLTPTVWRAALATGWTPPQGFTAVTGGEAMDATLAKRITAQGATLTNSYGPTEATVVAIAAPITAADIAQNQIPIGTPLPGVQAMILDDQLNPCPPGTPGALYLAGPQLSAGYIGRPGQTAAAFIAHPTRPGLRAYHTGDLAAWRMDGRIAYLGRIDDQIKIRGMRVELAEIEACLRAQAPATCPIAAAAVTLQEDMLAAYIVLAESAADTATPQNTKAAPERIALDPAQSAQIRAALAQTLPAHMVPAAIAAISHIPMTASGKINKAALPALSPQNDTPFAAPQGPLETQIAEQISDLIAAETGKPPAQISRHDSFFALGGHSLMAVRLIARLQETTATQIPLRALFEAKTIAALAAELGAAQKHAQLPPITAADRSQNLPLSYAQERLWFVERFAAPGTIAEVMGFDLTGPLDQPRLRAVFAALYARHEALRLIVDVAEGAPVQRFAAATDLPWHLHDLRDHSPQDQEAQIAALRAAPVDPAQGAFRIDLVQTGAEQHLLILALHHMIYDGVSLAVILAEIATLWAANGNPAALPARDIAYADFALWQRAALKEGPLKEGLDRFVTTLANPPAPLAIPADRPRPDHPTHAAAQIPVHLPAALTADLRALAQAQNASLFMLLQTALATLMAREARTDDIIIGTVAAGRAQAEVETAVGPFFNMIALRHKIDPAKSFTQTLAAARTQALTAFDDQLVPFEAVIERTITHRDARTAVSPLFQILFQLHTEAGNLIKPITLGGMAATPRDWGKMLAMQDLTFDLFETEAGIEGRLTYAIELFDAPRMQALIQRYIQILQSIVQNPDAACQTLNILPADQAAALADLSAAAPLDGPLDGTVALPVRIAAHAAATPAAPALAVAAGAPLGYAALCAAARARARGLTAAGLAPGQVAAVLVDLNTADQAEDLIINLLAIWQAGGTFLPLNAADPAARLQQMAADAACALVLTPAAHHHIAAPLAQVLITDDPALAAAQALLCDDPEAPALDAPDPDATAYIYYTSGTTGIPKGVPITHQALAAFTAAIGQIMGTGQDTRALSAASPLFDALFMDLAATLAQGGLLIRLSARHLASPGYLQQAAAAHQANYMDLTPTVWRAALATGWTPPQGFTAVTGGEAMDATLAKRITAQGATLTNSYGPTEATVVAIAAPITAADIAQNQIPIGTPLPGVQAMILDDQLNPCPPGTPGALYLAGPQLSAGYIGRPGQTAAAFIAHPTRPGLRAYHTGDLAAWRMDGRIAYLGRIDDQIKIRGMRVELAEIEACLRAQAPATCPIAAAAVTLQEDMLAAYIVLAESAADTATPQNTKAAPERIALDPAQSAQIRAALAQTLPAHMVPAAIAAISHIPMTASGKINKAALPALSPQNDTPFAAPQGPLETQIAEQISDLIAAETGKPPAQISRHDSFFALGGHSLMAVRLIARLQETTATQIPLRALFEANDVAELAGMIDKIFDEEMAEAAERADLKSLPEAPKGKISDLATAQTILLTGVTGFLGKDLLRELLNQTDAQIICIIEDIDTVKAKQNLLADLQSIPNTRLPNGYQNRVDVIFGELAEADLGLRPKEKALIINEAEVIVHNSLDAQAITGTAMPGTPHDVAAYGLLQIASKGRPKAIIYASALGVFDTGRDDLRRVYTPASGGQSANNKYLQARWPAERLLVAAREKGYQSTLLRPGLSFNDPQLGREQTPDFAQGLTALFISTGSVPDISSAFGLRWINLDRAVQMTLDRPAAETADPIGEVFDQDVMSFDVFAQTLRVEVVPLKEWLVACIDNLETQTEHPAVWLLSDLRACLGLLDGDLDELETQDMPHLADALLALQKKNSTSPKG